MRMLATISGDTRQAKARCYTGLPPQVTNGKDTRQKLGDACFLVIEESTEGVYLFRYSAGGSFVGDTWHLSVDDAIYQAAYEYGDGVQEWDDVPAEVEDVITFGRSRSAAAQ